MQVTAAGMRDLLAEVAAALVRQAKRQHDRGAVRARTRLLREIRALPDSDPRLVKLAGYPPAMIVAAIPDGTVIPAGSAGQFLDTLTGYLTA